MQAQPTTPKTPRGRATGAVIPLGSSHAWTPKQLEQSTQWLDGAAAAIGGEGERTLQHLWRRYPNLREATERLARHVTPFWPGQKPGTSALQEAIEQAYERVRDAGENQEDFEGRIVAVYLYGLRSMAPSIAEWTLFGTKESGDAVRWSYFEAPQAVWCARHQIRSLYLRPRDRTGPAAQATVVKGVETHLIAAIATTVDAGRMAIHAPNG